MRKLSVFVAVVLATSVAAQTVSPVAPSDRKLEAKVEAYLRNYFAWGATYAVKVGPVTNSPVPGLYQVPVEVTYKGQSETGAVYVSHDGRYILRGEIHDMSVDPFAADRSKLRIANDPAKGPAKARVTVVEFSDFECPHCRELYTVLKTVEPEFPQVRFVFKNFPLTQIHPWAMTAALAARCAFEHSPAAFWKVHNEIFENQSLITAGNAWDELKQYDAEAGVNPETFGSCMIDPATKKAVQADLADGKTLGVVSTPTIFINGREIVGGDRDTLEHLIRYELFRFSTPGTTSEH